MDLFRLLIRPDDPARARSIKASDRGKAGTSSWHMVRRALHCSRRTACPSAAASAPHKVPKSLRSCARSGRLHPTITVGRDFPPEKPFCLSPHPLLSYHDDQQLRPSRPLELLSPCCILVPTHPRLCHWRQLAFPGSLTPITMLCTCGAGAGRTILTLRP